MVGDLTCKLGSNLPRGVEILAAKAIFRKTESLTAAINVAEYRAELKDIPKPDNFQEVLTRLLENKHLSVQRITPKESKRVDIREHILEVRLEGSKEREILSMRLRVGQSGHARPREILAALLNHSDEELLRIPIHRTGLFIERDGRLISPLDVV
jgi:radical SAM-linked protein